MVRKEPSRYTEHLLSWRNSRIWFFGRIRRCPNAAWNKHFYTVWPSFMLAWLYSSLFLPSCPILPVRLYAHTKKNLDGARMCRVLVCSYPHVEARCSAPYFSLQYCGTNAVEILPRWGVMRYVRVFLMLVRWSAPCVLAYLFIQARAISAYFVASVAGTPAMIYRGSWVYRARWTPNSLKDRQRRAAQRCRALCPADRMVEKAPGTTR